MHNKFLLPFVDFHTYLYMQIECRLKEAISFFGIFCFSLYGNIYQIHDFLLICIKSVYLSMYIVENVINIHNV